MKPITDDIVLSLIERAERRCSALHPANEVQPVPGAERSEAPASGRIISLDFVRRHMRSHQTVSGFFCYAPRT